MKDIIFKIKPCPKPRMTRADTWKKRPCVLRYFAFKHKLNILAKQLNYIPGDTLAVTFVLEMPKSWSKKKKELMNGKPHQQKPDLDNMVKAFKDALLKEDSHVHTYSYMHKRWGEEPLIVVHQSE